MKSSSGRAGCGCLIVMLVVFLITAALMMHPFSLRLLADRLIYKDHVVTSDAILVPYFPEDKNGEIFMDAFREFWAGNGKLILVEEQRVFGLSLTELVQKLAKERGDQGAGRTQGGCWGGRGRKPDASKGESVSTSLQKSDSNGTRLCLPALSRGL